MHCRRRDLEIALKIGLSWRRSMELRVRVNEVQILTLLRREPRLQHRHWTEGPRRWLLVSESVQQCAEPTADGVEHTPDLAVLAMIRFSTTQPKRLSMSSKLRLTTSLEPTTVARGRAVSTSGSRNAFSITKSRSRTENLTTSCVPGLRYFRIIRDDCSCGLTLRG